MSARELVEAQRAAFLKGCAQVGSRGRWYSYDDEAARVVARHLYPLPTVTRPRVVTLPDGPKREAYYRLLGGTLECRLRPDEPWSPTILTRSALHHLLGLFADPTETVDAE